MSTLDLRKELNLQKDNEYKEFHERIVSTKYTILGVRVPAVRKLAKSIKTREEIQALLDLNDPYYEEVLAGGLAIGALKEPLPKKEDLIYKYISNIDNWALCDSFCSALKSVKKEKDEAFAIIQKMLKSQKTYEVRFALVLLNNYFVQEEYLDFILKTVESVKSKEYYINMAAAWLFSSCYILNPDMCWNWLLSSSASPWIINKGIQKCLESYRVDSHQKEKLRKLRSERKKREIHAV